MRTVTTSDGCELAAYDFGGAGPPLLFAHATGFNAQMWLPIIEHLRDAFHCYGVDQRGHGASPTPVTGDFEWRRMGLDLVEAADALGLGRAYGAGHSGGGAHFVLAEQDRPGSWERVWTYEPVIPDFPIATAPDLPENPLAAGALRRRDHFDSRQAAFDNFAGKPPFDVFDPAVLALYVEYGFVDATDGGVTLACRREDEAAAYRGAFRAGTFEGLDRVSIPVHAACGAVSNHFTPERLGPVVDRLPHGTLEVMEGLGHFGPFEAPERVAASIRKALT